MKITADHLDTAPRASVLRLARWLGVPRPERLSADALVRSTWWAMRALDSKPPGWLPWARSNVAMPGTAAGPAVHEGRGGTWKRCKRCGAGIGSGCMVGRAA